MHRALLVGAGGWPGVWIREFLPALAARVRVVDLVDRDPAVLARGLTELELPSACGHATLEAALAATDADVVFLCTPPPTRVAAFVALAGRGLPVLCEKPIAPSWSDALAIRDLVAGARLRVAIVQNYRETPRIRALAGAIADGRVGRIDTIVCRFAADYTPATAGGAFRHQVPDAMLYEGATHHLDMFRHLAGADAVRIAGWQWSPSWSPFSGPTNAAFVIEAANGVMGSYEMRHLAAGHRNEWHHEAYRIEGETGTLVLDDDETVRLVRHDGEHEVVTALAPDARPTSGHVALIGGFLDWLDGGPPPPTVIDDNLRTAALTFAAVEAARTGRVVDVATMLGEAGLSCP